MPGVQTQTISVLLVLPLPAVGLSLEVSLRNFLYDRFFEGQILHQFLETSIFLL